MSYMVISSRTGHTQEIQGPTYFGDSTVNNKIVTMLKGRTMEADSAASEGESDVSQLSTDQEMGFCFKTDFSPCMVLNKLDEMGFRFISFGMGSQSAIWTLYQDKQDEPVGGKKVAVKKEPAAKKAPAKRAPTKKTAVAVDEVENEMPTGGGDQMNGKAKAAPAKGKAPAKATATKKAPAKPAPVVEEESSEPESQSQSEDEESEEELQPVSAKSTVGKLAAK